MSREGARAWKWFCLIGIALWVGLTVLAAVLNDDPSDGRPVLLTFAGGGATFFGLVFGISLWSTRSQADPHLDELLAELAVEPELGRHRASQIGAMRQVARIYLLLGAVVTALGFVAIVQEALEVGSPRTTLTAMVVIVVLWALAVPFVLRQANRASGSVLSPLGLEQSGGVMAGERHGRRLVLSTREHHERSGRSGSSRRGSPRECGARRAVLCRASRGAIA